MLIEWRECWYILCNNKTVTSCLVLISKYILDWNEMPTNVVTNLSYISEESQRVRIVFLLKIVTTINYNLRIRLIYSIWKSVLTVNIMKFVMWNNCLFSSAWGDILIFWAILTVPLLFRAFGAVQPMIIYYF